MAYAAAVSLSKTLRNLQLCDDPFSNSPNYPKSQIEIIHEKVDSLKLFLVQNRDVTSEFESAIREAIYEAEDVIDSQISTQFLSLEAEISQSFYGDLDTVIQKFTSLVEMATSEKFTDQTLNRKISNSVWKKFEEIECRKKYRIVGRDKDLIQVKDRLVIGSEALEIIPIVGIAGMGKTTLIDCVCEDELIRKHFNRCCGVELIKYNKRETLLSLLGYTENMGDEMLQKTDKQLAKLLYNSLKHYRYLVILDNVRDVVIWNDLKELFPNYYNGSRILITTTNLDVARTLGLPHRLDRLRDKDSLTLLQDIVLDDDPCSNPQIAVIAKDIARSCKGLPHAVVITGRLLLCAEMTVEYWEIVLSSINTCDNYVDLMEAVVSLTYKHLPRQLQTCFLYMATCRFNHNFHMIKFMRLCIAEGFIEIDNSEAIETDIILTCLVELCARGLVNLCNKVTGSRRGTYKIREEVFHNFAVRKAEEEKFFLVINNDTDYAHLLENEYGAYNHQRRLCIYKNIVPFVMRDLDCSKTSVSTVRSLLFWGPKCRSPSRSWLEDFELLRVLDALEIRFYTFPLETLQLVHLRYLILTYNGELPAAVSKLRNLQVLIVRRYLSAKCCGSPSYLPIEIWTMKELRLLMVIGSDLPDIPRIPTSSNHVLEKLSTLLDVGAHSLTPGTLKRLINLEKLRVRIESLHEDESLSFFSHLHILRHLVSFECYIIYPDVGSLQVVPSSIPSFPSNLKHLNLSGCGFPWECISAIAALPNLESLKLQSCAFQGPEWEVKTNEFPKLSLLLLEDMDLENWTFEGSFSFPMLKSLIIRHCYKLRRIPLEFGDISDSYLEMIEVVDCSFSLSTSAIQIKLMHSVYRDVQVFLYFSAVDY